MKAPQAKVRPQEHERAVRPRLWVSVRANTKPNRHQNRRGRARRHARREPALTRGDLRRESGAGVSRGHSSERKKVPRKRSRAKGRSAENHENAKLDEELPAERHDRLLARRDVTTSVTIPAAERDRSGAAAASPVQGGAAVVPGANLATESNA